MNSKEAIIFLLILLLIPSIFAVSNVQHSIDGNKINLTFQGTPPFWINIRGDKNIGQPGGYIWAKTNKDMFTIDLGFAINPSNLFYYGVKDAGWSSIGSFTRSDTISVAAINLSYEEYALENLQNKINSLMTNHPDVDLIVTPEYLFYGGGFAGLDYRNDPVIVNCQNSLCDIKSINTVKSNELKNIINAMQNIASKNNINIVLGTIAEMEEVSGTNFTFDTQLIIDRQGNIIGKHRMYPLVYPVGKNTNYCENNAVVCQQAQDSILNTDIAFSLTNKQGIIFKIIPIICGEKNDDKVIARLNNSNADFAVISEFDVDCNYELISKRIQSGENIFENVPQFTCEWILKIVFDKWAANNLLKGGNIVVADGFVPSAGLFNFNLKPMQDLEITEDYTYGKIEIS